MVDKISRLIDKRFIFFFLKILERFKIELRGFDLNSLEKDNSNDNNKNEWIKDW